MLRLHRSARLAPIADALAEVLRVPPADPLDPEWVVVGSRPLERWLTARLAERLGVCAHVRFLSPTTLQEELAERLLGLTREAVRGWRAEHLAWRLLAALPAHAGDPAFDAVRLYLEGADGPADVVGGRALAFARRLGECFARYASADPPRARRWDAGADEGWQSTLWRALAVGDDPGHPAAHAERALAALRAAGRPAGLPARLTWLALPGTPALHVDTLVGLAAAGVDVHAFVAAPARADAPAPLRASLGRLGDDLQLLLDRACARHGVAPESETVPSPASGAPATALDALRADLLGADVPRAGAPARLRDDDATFRVHACHGPMRQAEVLRDEVLALLDADPTLRPRDVLVLTPDVSRTAPLLQAAFAATGGAPPLPLRVLDRPQRRANAAADVALRVLELAASRVDAVAVLDLVTLPAVAARFGLDAGAEDVLRRWVREGAVRWGIDGADRADTHGLPADEEHTWRFGLERLLLGWGMPGDGRTLWRDALPVDAAEGSEAERLGRFAEACARLFAQVRAVRGARPLAEWRDVLRGVVDALVDDGAELVLARRGWRDQVDALAEEGAACARPVDGAAVRLALAARFDEPAGGEGGAHGVTLARLAPGRVVPARVVALVGLEDGAWPRARGGVGFDLLARERVPGAADANAEDRQRLLEAILAAGDRLLVTYTGRTLDTNEPVPPAVPVGELLDALDARCVRADDRRDADGAALPARTLVEVAHPMQPFGPGAFESAPPRSYDATHLAGARALRAGRAEAPAFLVRALPAPADRTVTVQALADFLASPSRAVLQGRLGVWLDAPDALEVDDPLELDGLSRWTLRDDVLARLLEEEGADCAPSLALQRAAGRLPHGPLGHVAFGAAVSEARTVSRLAGDRRTRVRHAGAVVDRAVGGWRLVGRVGPLFDGGLYEVHAGRVRAAHQLRLWARHLALHVAEGAGAGAPTSTLVGLPKKTPTDGRLTFAPVPDAEARLAELLDLYGQAMCTPLPLLPEPSLAYVEQFTPKRTPDDAHREGMAKAVSAWNDGHDAWAERLLGERPFGDERRFGALARALWAPVLAATGAAGTAEEPS